MWVVVAAVLVLFMQVGFAGLEMGFSRTKNAGTVIAKIMTNMSIAAICYWAVGFAFAFGGKRRRARSRASIIGSNGFFLQYSGNGSEAFPVMGLSDATVDSKFLFQFAFCAVSLAIVWGTTLERIKYSAYVIYAIARRSSIRSARTGCSAAAGCRTAKLRCSRPACRTSPAWTAVHLIGATGALAALPARSAQGQVRRGREAAGNPGPLDAAQGIGVLILFIGWFGSSPGLDLGIGDVRMGDVAVVTLMALPAAGSARSATRIMQRTIDIGMVANGMIAGLVGITAPSGYEVWPGRSSASWPA